MARPAAIQQSRRYQDVSDIKAAGQTYTPEPLAQFVAERIMRHFDLGSRQIVRILDPAVGDGALALALIRELRRRFDGRIELHAYDTDKDALAIAESRIAAAEPGTATSFRNQDFLRTVLNDRRAPDLLSIDQPAPMPLYDLIIANPPYVRTQVLGADEAQRLAADFGLFGRVDLYHAFLLAMARVLEPRGSAGFIVSNRFMTTRGGAGLRIALTDQLALRELWDLGDTKLFSAAVLPAVIVANGPCLDKPDRVPSFSSIYETEAPAASEADTAVDAFASAGVVELKDGRRFNVQHGLLDRSGSLDSVWRIATESGDTWMAAVEAKRWKEFGDIGKVRVGVKTCADKVFIRHDWTEVCGNGEPELLRQLTTHHGAARFRSVAPKKNRRILYPHEVFEGRRRTIPLDAYPHSRAYLEAHKATLSARSYVIEGGRQWYELWVPQDPAAWAGPKMVFRDISEKPTFWIDLDGTIVNGDCYWLALDSSKDVDLIWLAVAVANSTFVEAFYDRRFNNKLYAGRRRFITQYVEKFPLPNPDLDISRQIIAGAKEAYVANHGDQAAGIEECLDRLVWQAFGLT